MHAIRRAFAIHVVRPYIRLELPAWGKLFDIFVGGHTKDWLWADVKPRWMRGKLHDYEMVVDLSHWSPRATFFLGRFYDLGTQSIVRQLLTNGDTFVDIGANIGMISLVAARQVGANGKVIAFEPNPVPRATFAEIIDRNKLQNIDLRPIGLADREDNLLLSVPKVNHGEGSFGKPAYDSDDLATVECPVRIGDRELDGVSPKLIKIDVEGFETNVLRGLSQVIERSQPFIATEVIAAHLEHAGSSVAELDAFFRAANYSSLAIRLVRRGMHHEARLVPVELTPDFAGDVLWIPRARANELTAMRG